VRRYIMDNSVEFRDSEIEGSAADPAVSRL